jgi:signal transduction histidine kinase/CheY-like chemotaxis protein
MNTPSSSGAERVLNEPIISPITEQQIAGLLDLTRTMTEAEDLHTALHAALQSIAATSGWCYGQVWLPDAQHESLYSSAIWHDDDKTLAEFAARSAVLQFALGVGLLGSAWQNQRGEWVPDLSAVSSLVLHPEYIQAARLRSGLFLPITMQGRVLAVLVFFGREVRPKHELLLRLITLVAAQIGSAIHRIQSEQRYRQVVEDASEDITEQRQINETLERRVIERTAALSAANAELQRAARLKDEFLANMSHELRTPLNTILTLTEAVTEGVYGALNERQQHALAAVTESGQHLLALINDILDLTKIESGKVDLVIDALDVEEVCTASLRMVRQIAQAKQIQISRSLDPLVDVVMADPRRLKQILVNLLSNAVKFTPEGGQVRLLVCGDREAEAIHFSVEDTGIGIDPADIPRLFKSFVQLDSRLNRRHEGTGLGLALVAHLTELHNGGISVRSTPGQGSCFTVTLPWRAPLQPKLACPTPIGRVTGPASHEQPVVLMAEDNEMVIRTTNDYLSAYGYSVRIARNGAEALAMARELLPDVILMDIHMPVMDGFEAMRQIRADPSICSTPIIAVTALAMVGDREQCLEAGADDYLSKPVKFTQLIEWIERLRQK